MSPLVARVFVGALALLWAGTQTGLDRYGLPAHEGESFDAATLSGTDELSIAETDDGAHWAGTDNGLSRLKPTTDTFSRSIHAAQTDPPLRFNGPTDAGDYTVRHWDTDTGLTHNYVNAVTQTPDGYVWVATLQGLARFDGATFRTFTAATTPGLNGDRLRALAVDSTGALWVSTETGGVSRYQDGRFEPIPFPGPTPYANDFHVDHEGDVWAATSYEAYRTRGGLEFDVVSAGLGIDRFHSVWTDPDGTAWFGGPEALLRTRGGRSEPVSVAGTGRLTRVFDLLRAGGGTLWALSYQGVARVDGPAGDALPFPTPAVGGGLTECPDGTVWVAGTNSGVYRVLYDRLVPLEGAPQDAKTVYCDGKGGLWVGTTGRGLYHFRPRLFGAVSPEDGLRGSQTHGLFADDEGAVWATSHSGGVARVEGGRVETLQVGPDDMAGVTWTAGPGPSGAVYVGADGGLFRWGGREFNAVEVPEPVAIWALHLGPSGTLWAGGNGLFRVRGDRAERLLSPERFANPVNTSIRVVLETRRGDLWFGLLDGLCRWSPATGPSGPIDCYGRDRLPNAHVRAIVERPDGALWVGTYGGGLLSVRDGAVRALDGRHGLPDPTVHSVLFDELGYVWLSSNGGVFRARVDAVEALFDGEADFVPFDRFTSADGMPATETNGGFSPAAAVDAKGRFWYPTTAGLTFVDPADIGTRSSVVPVLIEGLVADGSPIDIHDGEVSLAPGTDRLVFQFTGIPSFDARGLQFRYRVEGHDDGWVHAGSEREAVYTNLPAGRYVFRVQALEGNAGWSDGAALAFAVRPFWYETAAFRALGLLAMLGFAVVAYRVQRSHVVGRERERSRTREAQLQAEAAEARADALRDLDESKGRFFANISHEFRTPLTLIAGPLEAGLEGDYGPLPAGVQTRDRQMLRATRRLLRLVGQLLDLARLDAGKAELQPRPGRAGAFAAAVARSFTPLAEREGVTLTVREPADEPAALFDPDALEKVVSNLVSNAVKFTGEGGRVVVAVGAEADGGRALVEVTVKDTGPGIEPEALGRLFDRFEQARPEDGRRGTGLGLALTRDLVDLMGGTLHVESEPGFGSAFTARLPLPLASEADPPPVPTGDGVPDDPEPVLVDVGTPPGAPTVLVVDDNPDVRALVRRTLGAVRTAEAGDGEEALALAREAHEARRPYDLVLADVMMPRLDGFGLCRAIRADPSLRGTPVVLLTARATPEDAVEGLLAGADDYVAKPFHVGELRARVARLVRSPGRRAGGASGGESDIDLPLQVSVPSADESFVRDVLRVAGEHLGDPDFTADSLAAEVGLSSRQLARRLKGALGQTPGALLRELRLTQAALLLERDAGTVAEVAYRCGFRAQAHFSRSFKARFGRPPSTYGDAEAVGEGP